MLNPCGDDAADLFRRACRSCHTIDGYRPLRPAYDGTDRTFIEGTIRGIHAMRGNMPPFLGTDEEIVILATYLDKQIDHRPLAELYCVNGLDLGRRVYQVRCGRCNRFGGYNDKSELLIGLSEVDYSELLDYAGDLADEMPAFTATEKERQALIEYLLSLSEETNHEPAGL